MADRQPTNVIEAGNIIKGLMTGETSEEVTPVEEAVAEPTVEQTEETETQEEVSSEETVNPSDVPYMKTEEEQSELSESEDIQENSEEPIYTVTIDGTNYEVTQDELIQGYQRNADYTRIKLHKHNYNKSTHRLTLKNFTKKTLLKLLDLSIKCERRTNSYNKCNNKLNNYKWKSLTSTLKSNKNN